MITWGISALGHDASIAVVEDGSIRYWKKSQDEYLSSEMIEYSISIGSPNNIVWFERPWIKKTRQLYAGQYNWAFDINQLPSVYLNSLGLSKYPVSYMSHHLSHAAAGFLTSPYKESTVVVLDAIGEWESATIWKGTGTKLKKLWGRSYPTSLGLFYSAFTHLIGFRPVAEEHLLQQMAEHGDPKKYLKEVKGYWNNNWETTINLHKGVINWPYPIRTLEDKSNIAASVQQVFEEQADWIMLKARQLSDSKNLVYMGGCAMNSRYNNYMKLQWDDVWMLPIPGDASSSLGAALYKQQKRAQLNNIM